MADPCHLVSSPSRDHTNTGWPVAPTIPHIFSVNYLARPKVPDISNHFCEEQYSKGLEGVSQERVKSPSFFFFSFTDGQGWSNPSLLPYPLLHSYTQLST